MLEWNINGTAADPTADRIPVTLSAQEMSQIETGDVIMWVGSDFVRAGAISGGTTEMLFIRAGNISEGTLHPDRLPAIDASKLTGTIDYARLPPLNISGAESMPPFISSITPITPNGTQEIEILGEYFSPLTTLTIPGATVNSLEVRSPNKIIASISKSGLSGNKAITVANGANTNQMWADGIKFVNVFSDQFWQNVILFVKGDDNSFIDHSSSSKTILSEGNIAFSTTEKKYGESSIFFNGSSVLKVASDPSLNLGSSDFTLEMWINPAVANPHIMGWRENNNFVSFQPMLSGDFGALTWWAHNNGVHTLPVLTPNTWQHIAICRYGSNFKYFKNGILESSFSSNQSYAGNTIWIGASAYSPPAYSSFYLNHLRITKGIARYVANFNPETDYLA